MKINEIFGQILLKISYFLTNLSSKWPNSWWKFRWNWPEILQNSCSKV